MLTQYFTNLLHDNKLSYSWLINSHVVAKSLVELKDFIKTKILNCKVELEQHPDFYLVQKQDVAKDIKIEQIRGLQQFLYKKSGLGGAKIVVIYEADLMNLNAANSALKILEEPPENSYIFLITNKSAAILPTIRSRCSKYEVYSHHDEESVQDDGNILSYLQFLDLLLTNDIETKHKIIKELKDKNRELWKIIGEHALILMNKTAKKSYGAEQLLSDREITLMNNAKMNIINKFDYISQLISDTIEYDLDLSASFIILLDEIKK